MSELISKNDNRATIRWKLLTGASALALTAYVATVGVARAEDTSRPLLWLEFGAQPQWMQGTSSPFEAPFMFPTAVPDFGVYGKKSFGERQAAPHFNIGGDAKITFQPEDSDWVFSASIQYGRSHNKKHSHYQGPQFSYAPFTSLPGELFPKYAAPFSDVLAIHNERHTVLDFKAGKDVGLGIFGHDGKSTISFGVHAVQLTAKTDTTIYARPNVAEGSFAATFYQYNLYAHASRSFHGIGPSLSWEGSAALAGNSEQSELMLDWGIDGAVLFGKQRAKVGHGTSAYHFYGSRGKGHRNVVLYALGTHSFQTTRSHSVTVPDISAFAGISFRLPHSKVSFGYRAEILMNAMDTGIDVAKKSNLTFNGPYASISIGLGD